MNMKDFLIYAIVFLFGALVLYLVQKLTGLIKTEERSQPNTMDTRTIKQMVNQYRNNHLDAINSTLGLNDAHSVSFGLKTLKKFIADIEYQTKKRNPGIGIGALGVRFYYAAYPKEGEWENFENEKSIGKDYAGKHTLVMIPTLKKKINNGSCQDYDFNPLDESTYLINEREKQRPVAFMAMDSTSNDDQSGQVMAQNHGQLIPPAEAVQETY
ncbi:hypothetical protein GCM10022289_06540 [Pedobacter jeongneungensis]|uniref:Uncharacterized protein n=2 Tax=Pedobacter jeongneungensis TaxID=947309 RepID=A0ABP8B4W9_9SPHI